MAEYIAKSEIYRRYFNNGNGVVRLHVYDIDVIPAADVAPVVHGRWVLYGKNHCYCSHCGMVRNIKTQIGCKYCPICNAKMDKEAPDGD